jgi:glycosyltransferase involved in cell wall biosynthesis
LKEELSAHNIDWHYLRYHKRPSLPATVYDVLAGARYARRLVRQNRIEMVHARSHIPAVIALLLKKKFSLKMIFDIRGLMAEEYVDAGHWRAGTFNYHLTKRMERRCLASADGVVTLTEAIWPIIKEWEGLSGRDVAHRVIPCCADLERFRFDEVARRELRAKLDLEGQFVLVYSGSIGGWYLTEEMADFFRLMLRERPRSVFLWLTQSGHDVVRGIMQSRGIEPERFRLISAAPAEVPAYLAASDAGIAFIKPCFSKLASSPTPSSRKRASARSSPILRMRGTGRGSPP